MRKTFGSSNLGKGHGVFANSESFKVTIKECCFGTMMVVGCFGSPITTINNRIYSQ